MSELVSERESEYVLSAHGYMKWGFLLSYVFLTQEFILGDVFGIDGLEFVAKEAQDTAVTYVFYLQGNCFDSLLRDELINFTFPTICDYFTCFTLRIPPS